MPNLLDVAKLMVNQINSNEITGAVSASEPWTVEISQEEFDKVVPQITGLMTFDSAVNNRRVVDALKGKVDDERTRELKKNMLGLAEDKIAEKLSDKFGLDLKDKRLDEQLDSLSNIQLKTGSNDLTKEISTLREQLVEKDTAFSSLEKESAKKLEDYKIDSFLMNKLSNIPLADPFKDSLVKKGLYDTAISEVKTKANLSVEGDSVVLRNPQNPELKLYGENNKEIGIDDIINPLMRPYIQATPSGSNGVQKQTATTVDSGLPEGINPGSPQAMMNHARETGRY